MVEILPHEISWPEIEAGWRLESELQKTPPRRLVLRAGEGGCGGKALGCFLGGAMWMMFVFGLMLSLWAGLALLIMPLGVNTPGQVIYHQASVGTGRQAKTESYFFYFRFTAKGQSYIGRWPVSAATYLQIRDGEKVTVRYFPFAPGIRPLIEEGFSPWMDVWLLGPLGLVMLAISGLYLYAVLWPRPGKRLVRWGEATCGIVARREAKEATSTSGHITYLFRVGDRVIEKKMRLGAPHFADLGIGAVTTVLYDAKRPSRAIPYRCCDFRAQG